MKREEALAKLEQDKYEPELLRQDREFLLKKLDFSEEEFVKYLKEPGKSYKEFKSYTRLLNENILLKVLIKTAVFIKKPFNKLFKLS